MNRGSYKAILAVIALTVFGAVQAAAQTGQPQVGDKKASVMDMSGMMNHPE